jgi:hypothetical protein
MNKNVRFTKRQVISYSKLAATAVQHSVSLDEIIKETRRYHGDEFANAVESCVRTLI